MVFYLKKINNFYKIEGNWIGGHTETYNLRYVSINHGKIYYKIKSIYLGPGDIEWFCLEEKYAK